MTSKPTDRAEVPIEDRWDLEALYSSDEAWEQDFRRVEGFPGEIASWSDTLSRSPARIASGLDRFLMHNRLLDKLYTYAYHRRDEDLSRTTYQDMLARIISRVTDYAAASSFLIPELLRIPEDRMSEWIETRELRPYLSWLEDRLCFRSHMLSESEERLLDMAREPL